MSGGLDAYEGLTCVFDIEPLRLLDVALWWFAVRGHQQPVADEE